MFCFWWKIYNLAVWHMLYGQILSWQQYNNFVKETYRLRYRGIYILSYYFLYFDAVRYTSGIYYEKGVRRESPLFLDNKRNYIVLNFWFSKGVKLFAMKCVLLFTSKVKVIDACLPHSRLICFYQEIKHWTMFIETKIWCISGA